MAGSATCTVFLVWYASLVFVDYVHALFFFQAEDGIRDAQESRGLGDVYKRQELTGAVAPGHKIQRLGRRRGHRCQQRSFAGHGNRLSLIHI